MAFRKYVVLVQTDNMDSKNIPRLNFPESSFKMKEENKRIFIFDDTRKKYLVLTPEEWVRQNCLHFLRNHKNYPGSLLAVEKEISLNNKQLRYDIVAYSKAGAPLLLVECKAPGISITQQVFDQIAAYNLKLKVPYLLVTNGINHISCMVDFKNSKYLFLKEIPNYNDIYINS
jgi:type I site-specific restriction-modification system R (restriction) subunit